VARMMQRGRPAPARPQTFGAPVMGDPLPVPEQPIHPEPAPEDAEPLWLKMPPELADFFDLGFVHTEHSCPEVVMRMRDDMPNGNQVELTGPPYAFAGLARVIVALCESVPCLACHLDEDAYTNDEPAEQAS